MYAAGAIIAHGFNADGTSKASYFKINDNGNNDGT